MRKLSLLLIFNSLLITAQTPDEQKLKDIYDQSLTNSQSYSWLDHLSNKIGARLSGSANAQKAIEYTKAELDKLGLDRVYLQEVMVPHWVRGEKESAYIEINKKKIPVPICALGMSVATPEKGILAEVVEVQSIKELEILGVEKIKGRIVFFNRPMNNALVEPMEAYRDAGDQRGKGPREASKYGAVGVIVRSLTLRLDDFPHTGGTWYGDIPAAQHIPAAAISTNGAALLSKSLKTNPNLKFFFKQSCKKLDDVLSYNVIGEITGSEHPEQIMVVGGHLDSWDLGDGAQDDGAGVVQSMEVLRIFKLLGYKPKHTIRAVLFINEENGVRGGDAYAAVAQSSNENHIFAMESDSGGFTPRGFTIEGDEADVARIQRWKPLFEPYMLHLFAKGHSGTDVEPIKSSKIIKVGLKPDTQRYFDHHHAATDTFDAVNKRELELGAAAMTSLMYLVDQYGID
ncbi:peptidase M28 family protein [Flavobacterium magnum]|uniref:Carboxypeptidase Q n=1 Tax=Flavobacterium magnum TaxID=2162713 RepID=A0A2S0RGT1_9FLAO|nr:M28 family peptidase [Flavobacterium magnum]AWA30825.1 peptidase M28 family protein [Flavobacterium magnum]